MQESKGPLLGAGQRVENGEPGGRMGEPGEELFFSKAHRPSELERWELVGSQSVFMRGLGVGVTEVGSTVG